ncbi:NADH:flavin oxidoreductase [uncultured Anaerofustis sp.]|uniref:NADH:flavin oxidoreductase n=1 Tax=uncultured Anaerofustis sp. TaxID=904996 RepID=UPI0025F12767|nr:NADH:flavin oxidoreductase [uncultured Anaerofustis sp.]
MLFDSFTLKGNLIRNRIVMSPMVTYSLVREDGFIEDKHISYYEKRAKNEVGTIIVEASGIDGNQKAWNQIGVWDDKFIPGLKKLAGAINDNGAFSVIQLHNAGIKAKIEECPYGPSPLDGYGREMSKEDIEKSIKDFVNAAVRAKKAGFKAVELHGAHGYLLCEFTLRKYNKRNDEYGFENLEDRYRFPIEVTKAVRKAVGDDYPIYYRMGVNMEDIDDVIKGADMLVNAGVDVLNISSAFDASTSLEDKEHEFNSVTTSAKIIKENVNVPVICVNRISTPKRAEKLLKEGYGDFTAIGRELLSDYQWAYKAKNGIPINYCYHCKPKCRLNGGDNKCPNLIKTGDTLY